jgi:hypothetical protein
MCRKGPKPAEIVTRRARAVTALVCAYAVALTTVLMAWSALALASPRGGESAVICLARVDGAGNPAPAPVHGHHLLCGPAGSMAGCGADLVLTVEAILTPIAPGLLNSRLAAGSAAAAAPAIFLSDHRARGPPGA